MYNLQQEREEITEICRYYGEMGKKKEEHSPLPGEFAPRQL